MKKSSKNADLLDVQDVQNIAVVENIEQNLFC